MPVPHRWSLPPYSPDVNPIEQAWSKVTAVLRSKTPRIIKQLYQASGHVIRHITRQEGLNYFANCGCLATSNCKTLEFAGDGNGIARRDHKLLAGTVFQDQGASVKFRNLPRADPIRTAYPAIQSGSLGLMLMLAVPALYSHDALDMEN